ncbi:MAG: flavodoxin [Candidatus Cloacimonadota bacterium]|nr:MAG: flavodoxin [Candidatus Cloacimonadota bacterium]
MKTATVYYSYTGTTEKFVNEIKSRLNCDVIEIKPEKDIKGKGFKSLIAGGFKAMMKSSPQLMPYEFKADNYDLIIFASPVWAGAYAPAFRTFFKKEVIKNKKVSYLFTHRGGKGKTEKRFEEALAGNKILPGCDINAKNNDKENFLKLAEWIKSTVEG